MQKWNKLYMNSTIFQVYEFESVVILELNKAPTEEENRSGRKNGKRAIPPTIGVDAIAIIRY